jgi:hypothetical protein
MCLKKIRYSQYATNRGYYGGTAPVGGYLPVKVLLRIVKKNKWLYEAIAKIIWQTSTD